MNESEKVALLLEKMSHEFRLKATQTMMDGVIFKAIDRIEKSDEYLSIAIKLAAFAQILRS